MNRFIPKILIFATASLALHGCSDDVLDSTRGMTLEEAMQPSEYEVQLSAAADGMTSKAAINSNADGSFETNSNDTLGIMMLATGVTPNYKSVDSSWQTDCSWWNADDEYHRASSELMVCMNNSWARVVYDDETLTGSRIQLFSGKHYPLGSTHKYNFYAYGPLIPDKDLYFEADRVLANFAHLDGTKDMIYAYAVPGAKDALYDYAWSADYFRYKMRRTDGDNRQEIYNPVLAFKHKMMQLMFKMTAGGLPLSQATATKRSYDEAYNTRLMAVSILNVPDTVTMVLADRNNEAANGTLTYSEKNRNKQYFLREYKKITAHTGQVMIRPDSVLTPVCPTPKYQQYKDAAAEGEYLRNKYNVPDVTLLGCPADNPSLRQGIILPVLNENDRLNNPYYLQVVLEYPAYSGKYYYCSPIRLDSDEKKIFEAGCSYEITLKIYGPNTVEASASKVDWTTVSEEDLWKYIGTKEPEKKSTDDDTPAEEGGENSGEEGGEGTAEGEN